MKRLWISQDKFCCSFWVVEKVGTCFKPITKRKNKNQCKRKWLSTLKWIPPYGAMLSSWHSYIYYSWCNFLWMVANRRMWRLKICIGELHVRTFNSKALYCKTWVRNKSNIVTLFRRDLKTVVASLPRFSLFYDDFRHICSWKKIYLYNDKKVLNKGASFLWICPYGNSNGLV